jgi:hypothetical protein
MWKWKYTANWVIAMMAAVLFVSNVLEKYKVLGVPYQFVSDYWHFFWFRTLILGLLIPAPFAFQIYSRLRPRIKVEVLPHGIGTTEIKLNVKNVGTVKKFNAKCEIVAHRNDPNVMPDGPYDTFSREVSFHANDSWNLLLASIDGSTLHPSLSLCELSGREIRRRGGFTWDLHPPFNAAPEYDLRIVILSGDALEPQEFLFTLRPHSSRRHVEMIPRPKGVAS